MAHTVRQVLKKYGVISDLATTQMFLAPNTTDPDAQATIAIVRGLQRALNRLGAGLLENGVLNVKTAAVLDRVSGEGWRFKTWLQIYNDVDKAIQLKPALGHALSALADVTPVKSGLGTGAVLGLITLGYLLFVRRS